jgi:hypothetical protein
LAVCGVVACGGKTLAETSAHALDDASLAADVTAQDPGFDANADVVEPDVADAEVVAPEGSFDAGVETEAAVDAGSPDAHWVDSCGHSRPDVFGDEVVSFAPGATAGYGQSQLPCVVLGPPMGAGPSAGSLDVLSLGNRGSIVLAFDDVEVVDGPGPDLLVFENALPGFAEPGFVAVSEDGRTWHEWPCAPQDVDAGYPGCAGVHAVLSNPTNGISPTDPSTAGGDAFDLADLGVKQARYVRIRDSGFSHYGGTTGGFDLDAIAAVHTTVAKATPARDE